MVTINRRALHLYKVRLNHLRTAVGNGSYAALRRLENHDYPAADADEFRDKAWWPPLPGGSSDGSWVIPFLDLPENKPFRLRRLIEDGRLWMTLEQAARRLQVEPETIEKHYLPWLRWASVRQVDRVSTEWMRNMFALDGYFYASPLVIERENDVYVLEPMRGYSYEYRVPDELPRSHDVYDRDHTWVEDMDQRLYSPYSRRPMAEPNLSEGDGGEGGEEGMRVFNARGYDPKLEADQRRRVVEAPLLIDWAALYRIHQGRLGLARENRHSSRGSGGKFTKA